MVKGVTAQASASRQAFRIRTTARVVGLDQAHPGDWGNASRARVGRAAVPGPAAGARLWLLRHRTPGHVSVAAGRGPRRPQLAPHRSAYSASLQPCSRRKVPCQQFLLRVRWHLSTRQSAPARKMLAQITSVAPTIRFVVISASPTVASRTIDMTGVRNHIRVTTADFAAWRLSA